MIQQLITTVRPCWFSRSAKLARFASLPAALRCVQSRKENAEAILQQARQSRLDDLRVYFAECQFNQRTAYRHLEPGLQRDIKAFFGDYREASEQGMGWLEDSESLQLHTSLVAQLPPVLRGYINCGLKLYGDPESADLLKIHIRSGKLTLLRFDDFLGKPLPRLLQWIKLKLREQGFDVFDYGGEYPPPYLYRKSRYLNEEMPHYAGQLAFDEALESLNLFDLDGPRPKTPRV